MSSRLEEQVRSLPDQPGVYHYYNAEGRLLYVGKAKELSKRVKSYFRFSPTFGVNSTVGARIKKMISETASLSYIVVDSEHDALILENSLIKQLKPKYNILLRDDKTYPYIYIDRGKPFPRFEITRKVISGRQIEYFGPYSVGARDILDSVYELVPLVQKQSCLTAGRTCLYYQMKQCTGPCENKITPQAYAELVKKGIQFINRKKGLISALKQRMALYAEQLRFEEAAKLRDRIDRIDRSQQLSTIDLASRDNYDIFAIAHDEKHAAVARLFMRHGRIVSSAFDTVRIPVDFDRDELYERTLLEFYGTETPPVVAPILIADDFETREWVEQSLGNLFGKRATVTHPKRGSKHKVVSLAKRNAEELLSNRIVGTWEKNAADVQQLCHLERLPARIEIFDNSHLGGEAPVGAMVTFSDGAFEKSSYRHYHLQARDEYAQMRETLTRRIESFADNPPPDLWVIDGGRTLLELARTLLESAGVNLDVIAISKEKIDAKAHRAKGKASDLLHTTTETLRLLPSDTRLQWVQRLRDEAHRFAISFHKKSRTKTAQQSRLLEQKGISAAKIKKLLNHFGTFEAIYQADEEALRNILNRTDSKIITALSK